MLAIAPLLLAWAVCVVTPGPDFLAVLRTAAARGRAAGLRVGLGVVCGMACWATLALVGLSALMARYEHLYLVIRAVGAVLLIGYGLHVLWSTRNAASSGAETPGMPNGKQPQSHRHHWRLGLFTNLSNPKALVFFGALFATLMPHGASPAMRVALLAIMLAMGAGWFAAVSWCAGAQPVVAAYKRLQKVIDRVAGGVFAAIGLTLIPR
ncbi:LysE family translocator [Flexivirga meconopsidis]|uniref:LysE family translocator n=1 Tax=Flexivirga meconopsidis TaxID=2977121 RepID=UPI00224052CA|nr:LysE family transporter [Flexivirga meconopsidis]